MSGPRLSTVSLLLGTVFMLLLSSCAPSPSALAPSPTPDYDMLETRVAASLSGTLTAKAPTATVTPTSTETPLSPTATPTLLPTRTPTPTPVPLTDGTFLVFVRETEGQIENLVLRDLHRGTEEVLTHLTEPINITDVRWSPDGQWIAFVSAHNYIHSRNQERNVFLVRPDGTGLYMITGSYVDPAKAPGPYVVLNGQIVDPIGDCVVSAQGVASPVLADDTGAFELTGVPVSADWARAVCRDESLVLQGDVLLDLQVEATAPITISLDAAGRGWNQVSLSSQAELIAGTVYNWWLDEEDDLPYISFGVEVVELDNLRTSRLAIPEGSTVLGVDWSPTAATLPVGALTDEDGAGLYIWPEYDNAEPLVRMENTESIILTAAYPAWSPQGDRIVFELRQWSWWGDNLYRTLLMVWEVGSEEEPRVLVEPDWGQHAVKPGWSADGDSVFYQFSTADPEVEFWHRENGDIYMVRLDDPSPRAITRNGRSYLPALRPAVKPVENGTATPTETSVPTEEAEPTAAP
jgi:hypothetical protein